MIATLLLLRFHPSRQSPNLTRKKNLPKIKTSKTLSDQFTIHFKVALFVSWHKKKQAKKGEVVGANKSCLSAVFNGFEACKKKADYNNQFL